MALKMTMLHMVVRLCLVVMCFSVVSNEPTATAAVAPIPFARPDDAGADRDRKCATRPADAGGRDAPHAIRLALALDPDSPVLIAERVKRDRSPAYAELCREAEKHIRMLEKDFKHSRESLTDVGPLVAAYFRWAEDCPDSWEALSSGKSKHHLDPEIQRAVEERLRADRHNLECRQKRSEEPESLGKLDDENSVSPSATTPSAAPSAAAPVPAPFLRPFHKPESQERRVTAEYLLDSLRLAPLASYSGLCRGGFCPPALGSPVVESFSAAPDHSPQKERFAFQVGNLGTWLFFWWRYIDPSPSHARQALSLATQALGYLLAETCNASTLARALYRLAILHERGGELTTARSEYEQLLLLPFYSKLVCEAQLGLAEVATQSGQRELAVRYYRNTIVCMSAVLQRGEDSERGLLNKLGLLSYAQFSLSRLLQASGDMRASAELYQAALDLKSCGGPQWDRLGSMMLANLWSLGWLGQLGGQTGEALRQIVKISGIPAEYAASLAQSMSREGFHKAATDYDFLGQPGVIQPSTGENVAVTCKEVRDEHNCHLTSHQMTELSYGYVTSNHYSCTKWDCTLRARIPFTESHYQCTELAECMSGWSQGVRTLGECANHLLPMLASAGAKDSPFERLVEICNAEDLGRCHHPPARSSEGMIGSIIEVIEARQKGADGESSKKGGTRQKP